MSDATPWTVTQADRQIAAEYLLKIHRGFMVVRESLLDGTLDEDGTVQAFARHRHEAQAELVEVLKEARKCLGNAIPVFPVVERRIDRLLSLHGETV